jgi:hypothetical protein
MTRARARIPYTATISVMPPDHCYTHDTMDTSPIPVDAISKRRRTDKSWAAAPSSENYDGPRNCRGERHGVGTWTRSDGQQYAGEWHNGQRHGHGHMQYADGSSYVGSYRNGLRHGVGRLEKNDGFVYDGDWVDGKMHGHCWYCWKDEWGKMTYEWEMSYAQRHGHGKILSGDGSMYEGQWIDNKRHGRGIYQTGSFAYEGEWRDNLVTGWGKLIRDGKMVYEGRFWRGYWVSLNWLHVRFWIGLFFVRIVSPMLLGPLLVALAYVSIIPAPILA